MTAIKVLEDWKFTQWHETTGWVKGIYHQPHNGEMRRLVGNLHVYLVLRCASARTLLWNTQYTIRISLKTKTNYTDLSQFDGYSDFKFSSFEFNMKEKVTLWTKQYFTVGNISNHLFFMNYWLCTCYYTYCSSEK